MAKEYDAPLVRHLGSVTALTEQSSGSLNKVGSSSDAYTAAIQQAVGVTIVGDPQPAP